MAPFFAMLEGRLGVTLPEALQAHYGLAADSDPIPEDDAVQCDPLLTPRAMVEALDRLDALDGGPKLLPVLPGDGRQVNALLLADHDGLEAGMVVSVYTDTWEIEPLAPLEALLG